MSKNITVILMQDLKSFARFACGPAELGITTIPSKRRDLLLKWKSIPFKYLKVL